MLLQNNFGAIQASNQRLTRFRQSNPRVKAPSSVFESAVDDVASLYSVDSTASSTDFTFDDLVINSQAYRRALNQTRSNLNLGPLKEQSEQSSSDTETVVEASIAEDLPQSTTLPYNIPLHIRTRLTKNQNQDLFHYIDQIVDVKCKEATDEISGQLAQQLAQMSQASEELRQKYTKIKRYYFHMMQQKEQQAAENSRIVAEKAEIEQQKDYLTEQVLRFDKFFGENEAKRKTVVESHEKELGLKNEEIGELRAQYTKEQEISNELRTKLTQMTSEANSATRHLKVKDDQLVETEGKLRDTYDELINTKEMKIGIEEELQRYKGFDGEFTNLLKNLDKQADTCSSHH